MNTKTAEPKKTAEVIIVGGGLAGLSAAIYLGRAKRKTLLIEDGRSMARWEPDVQNYLGFPEGISGSELLSRGRKQVRRFGIHMTTDAIEHVSRTPTGFALTGRKHAYVSQHLLLATGSFHIPPEIPGVKDCLGHSMFFCKDCDGYRVQDKAIAIYGWTDEAAEYALAMLMYTDCVFITTDGRQPIWNKAHSGFLVENHIPVYPQVIHDVLRDGKQVTAIVLEDGVIVDVEAIFTTRGDLYYNELAHQLGAELDKQGQVLVDLDMRTSVPGLYAAGCVTPANCQMIVAAGQGATAAQGINRSLFELALQTHALRKSRTKSLARSRSKPGVKRVRSSGRDARLNRVRRGIDAPASLTHV